MRTTTNPKTNCSIGESWQLVEHVFYLHAPAGIGNSKLAPLVERLLGVRATARNFRSVQKIAELAQE